MENPQIKMKTKFILATSLVKDVRYVDPHAQIIHFR